MESDPLGLKAGWNTFSYVRGSPLRRQDRTGLVDFCDEWGTCYINQPTPCLDDPSLCNDWHDPGDKKGACFVTCTLHVILEAGGEHAAMSGAEAMAHHLGHPIRAACKSFLSAAFMVYDAVGVYDCHKECYECPDGKCPLAPVWNSPDNKDFPRLPPLPTRRR